MRRLGRFGMVMLIVGSGSAAASAERLVLRDGSSVETRGPWTAKGKLVVFHTAKGELASLRREEVDEEATARANQPAPAAASDAAARPKAPVKVLREEDLPKVTPKSESDTSAPGPGDGVATRQTVEIGTWERVATADGSGTEIVGTLRNTGDRVVEVVAVKVVVLDAAGKVLATVNAQPGRPDLPPLESTGFSARLPGLPPDGFSGARFEVVSRPLRDEGGPPDGGPQAPQAP